MTLWLTLDCLWTYLADGVPGCNVWFTKPVQNEHSIWSAEHHTHFTRAGKSILQHPDIDRLDKEVMVYFCPDIDLTLPRWDRFNLVRECTRKPIGERRANLLMTYEVSYPEWLKTLGRVAEWEAIAAKSAQRCCDPDLPF